MAKIKDNSASNVNNFPVTAEASDSDHVSTTVVEMLKELRYSPITQNKRRKKVAVTARK